MKTISKLFVILVTLSIAAPVMYWDITTAIEVHEEIKTR